jgi:hypothetical protein
LGGTYLVYTRKGRDEVGTKVYLKIFSGGDHLGDLGVDGRMESLGSGFREIFPLFEHFLTEIIQSLLILLDAVTSETRNGTLREGVF